MILLHTPGGDEVSFRLKEIDKLRQVQRGTVVLDTDDGLTNVRETPTRIHELMAEATEDEG